MSKQLKVNLLFQADTNAAVNNIQSLGALLNKISTKTTVGVDDGSLQRAVASAQQLQIHLQNAVNVDTGKLDLNKLNSSLKKSGQTLQTLTSNLQAAGPAGQQAFLKVATAVASAETPMIRVNQRLKDFGITLANTVKWQIASTAIHGISGMLTSAVSHAEDLNRALNDIRIVTGYSTETMSKFAVEASAAAKELSTTTTEYAKAALIFYQQGLSGDEVVERANTVIKLAQVTGQSAQMVSDQMTAIWNNFYEEGGKSLEYYADVLTKLGAATAASTDEIADGLEKFAAVADTVGLSYETAAASVATVVDKTRQSADVVGTSFKTIFARMQGLSLGETLEDGVDLNKYSQALASVGIQVLDAKGEMRDMDDILSELGEKWEGFGETTQIALAQTVGGVRQYNQMIALMDNWDSVVDNIELAKNATGELTKQQEIWSESYEAAAERVKQAQNELYEKFINDESIVKLNDIFAELIHTISRVIDSMGGVLPLALTLVGVFSKTLFPLLQAGFQTLRNNIAVLTGSAAKEVSQMQSQMQSALGATMSSGGMSEAQQQQITLTQKLLAMKQEMTSASKRMTLAQQQEAQAALESYEALNALVQGSLQHKAALEDEIRLMKEKMNTGSMKREMGEVSAIDNFRRQNQDSNLDVDSVVDEATNSSLGATNKAIADLDAQEAQNAQRKLEIEKEIKATKQSIAALTENLDQISDKNVKRQDQTLGKLIDQEDKLKALQAEAEALGESDEERRKHLEAVKQLQLEIAQASQQEVDKMVVGKASTSAFEDNKISRGGDVGALEQGMTNDVISTLGGTQDAATGDVQVGASLENLEKLYGLMAKYKTQISEITAIETDFSNASKKSADALAKKTKAETAASTAQTKMQKAQEKYAKLLKSEGKNSEAARKAKNELTKAQKEYKKAVEDVNKATTQSDKAQEEYIKTLSNSKTKILEMAKAAGASEKDLQALSDDFAKLGQAGSDQAIKNITQKLGDLKIASQDTDNSLDLLAQSMRESLLSAGFNPQQLDGLITKLQELGLITPDVANKMRMLGVSGEEVGNKLTATQTKFMSVAQSVASAAGQITMAIGAVKTMISAFDEGNTPLETFSSLMMGVSMILPIVIGATKALAAAEWVANAAKAVGTKLTATQTALETAHGIQRAILTVKTWLQTAAEVALKIAQNPILGAVILGLIVASTVAIGVMTGKTQDATEAQLEKNKADMEAAEQTAELTSKWAEQQDAMDGLIKKYKDLKDAGEDYSDTVDEIIEAVPELIEAYHAAAEGVGIDVGEGSDFAKIEQRMKNAAAVGDVEAIEAAQSEMDALISPQAAEAAQKGYTAAVNTLATTLTETQGSIKNGKYSVDVGGADSLFDNGNEEETAWNLVREHMGTDKATEGGRNFWGNYGGTLSLDTSTNDQFMEDYENLMAARDAIAAELGDELGDSGVYAEIDELLKATEEEYEKAKEMQAEAKKFGVYDAKANLEAQGMDITEIDSLEEYQKYRDALLNDDNVKGDPEAEAVARQWLEANANVQDYVKAEQKIGYVRDQAGDEAADALTAMYDELDDEEKKLFLEVDFTKYQSSAAVRAEIERLQSEADSQEIQVKMTAASTAKGAIKESGMTQEDWTKVRDSGIKWGEEGIVEFNDFLNMTYEGQMAYLDSITQQSQMDLIETKKAAIDSINAALSAGGMSQEEIEAMQSNLETLTSDLTVLEEQAFASATSLAELDNVKLQMQSAGIEEINYNAYAEGLMSLASAYENCAEEIEKYNLALASGNEQEVAKAEAVLRSSIVIGEAAEKYDLSAESLEAQAKEIMIANGWTEEYAETAAVLAVQNQRMNKGLTKLVNGWKDWKKTLSTTNKTSQDYADTLVELSDAVSDLVGWYDDLSLSSEFVEKNMELIEQASSGNVDAIIRLSAAVASYEVANATLNTTLAEGLTDSGALNALMAYAQTMGEGTTAAQAFASAQAGVQAGFDLIANNLNALNSGASLTDVLGGEEGMRQWVEQLNAYAAATGMTAEQMQTMLSSVGVTANVQTDYVEQDMTVPTYREQVTNVNYRRMPYTFMSGDGTITTGYTTVPEYTKATVPDKPLETKGYVGVASISMDGEGESPGVSPPTFTGRQAPSASAVSGGNSGGGGGGSTPSAPDKVEKREPAKKSDTVERYREVTDSIDNVTDALTRAERATERLWGKDKLDAMRQENKILAEQYKLLQQKAQEAEDYAKQDYNDLMDVADEIGVSVVVDTNTGDITNIEDVEKTLYDRLAAAEAEYNRKVEAYNAAVDAAGDSPTEAKVKELEAMKDALDAYERDIIGGIEDDISAWEDAEQAFQDSVETWEDAGLEAEEILDQMMQKNFDIWSESLQLEVEVNDRDLELLDYYLSKTEDNVYQMAEAAALMVGNLNSGFEGGQLGEYLDNLSIYGEKYSELTERLNSTDPEYQITSAQYKEGLEEIQSGLLDNLSSIQELDDAMLNYYGDTLSMVGEEIDKYTEKMEHQTSILEHYANMMDILGKSQDYEAMGTILEGQVETIKNELDVAEAEYNLYAEEAEKKRKLYEDAVAKGDAAAAELYKGEWEAAEEAAMEAQSNMLDKTEQWAEAMKAVVENKLQGLAKSLEEALTGGTSFDQINTQLERAASLQEEYLTTTNQIYETNKLMRTAQQEIDKTTNSVAKQRLKDFIKETDQLQDKSKLSKYELDIQKAKYDLLLAEIALEDAQNAKSTVRLQRDSEGNMGYIYTADQSQLSQAQQQLEDAQNSLYNIGLEGANNYAEKYNQTMQEMYDTLTSITEAYYNGEITSKEEYDRQMLEAQEYYYEQLENFQDLYGVALQTDTRVIKDAWSSSFNSMINNTSTWKDKVKVYSDEAAKTMSDWYNKVDEISQKTGLDNIANKVKTVTEESKALRDAVLGNGEDKGVIEALKNELTAVSDLTGGYANLRTTIQGLITDYENLMKTVNNAQNQQQEQENKNENGTGGTSGDSDTNNGDTDTSNGNTTNDPTPGSPTTTTPTIAKGQSVTVKTTATHFSRDGGNGTRMRSFVPGGNYTVMNFDEDEVLIGKGGVATGWVKKTDLVGFATGGYTGEWGPYGKMAMLHEKELVLNQGDTANFLASMEILERILEIIDLQSLNSQLGGILYTPSIGGNNTAQTVEQSVHIEASFPGVSDRNEIEEAFNNLINTASQYANRRF